MADEEEVVAVSLGPREHLAGGDQAQWRRVSPPAALRTVYPNIRVWQKDLGDGFLEVMRTVENHDGTWTMHLSICHKTYANTPGRYPTWEEQKEAVHEFAPGMRMASFILPRDDPNWVDAHSTTFHWWEVPE